jgi:hypothetical protein
MRLSWHLEPHAPVRFDDGRHLMRHIIFDDSNLGTVLRETALVDGLPDIAFMVICVRLFLSHHGYKGPVAEA